MVKYKRQVNQQPPKKDRNNYYKDYHQKVRGPKAKAAKPVNIEKAITKLLPLSICSFWTSTLLAARMGHLRQELEQLDTYNHKKHMVASRILGNVSTF